MNKIRLAAALLLALPLIAFGGNYLLDLFPLPEPPGARAGLDLLQAMRDGGLMTWIAASHVAVGVGLLLPSLRFASALLQLPLSLGIVAFHATMLPAGLGLALALLGLNLLVLVDPARLAGLTAKQAG